MLHHAARLASAASTIPPVFSLSAVLRMAAARAWARHMHSTGLRERAVPSPVKLRSSRPRNEPVGAPKRLRTCSVRHIDPETLSEHDITWTDPGRAPFEHYSDSSWADITSSGACLGARLSIPTSPSLLYQNLVGITASHPYSLSALIDYHFRCPRPSRSTRSYNFLVGVAMRHAAFGTVTRLLLAMREEEVPANMETWKLIVRWLVRTGRWDEAWGRVQSIVARGLHPQSNPPNSNRTHSIPLALWLELLGSQKRGALRQSKVPRMGPSVCHNDVFPKSTPVPLPSHTSPLTLSRYQTLLKALPPFDLSEIRPRTVLILVRAMIEAGQRDLALSTTASYLKCLPRLTRSQQHATLKLVHLHMYTLPIKPGLTRHFAQRRVLAELMDTHHDIRPSPKTLFLLLGSLRGCRRCGTLAMKCLQTFRKRWGPRIEAGIVWRRISGLALKEGRMDIALGMIQTEKAARRLRRVWRLQIEILGPRLRLSSHRVRWHFRRLGVENRRWALLERRILRMANTSMRRAS